MKILLTGGAGYIGSVTTKVLLDAGQEVIVVDNLSRGHRNAIDDRATFIQADVINLDSTLKIVQPDAVIHLAAFIAAGESMEMPVTYWTNNTIESLRMLESMRKYGVKKLIFASTAAVYGNPSVLPITEEASTNPTNTYGMTKLAVDLAIHYECEVHGLDATSLRFFNVAGAHGGHGERHPSESHLIPLLFDVIAGKRTEFTLYGTDYPTDDGTCIRDYIHVHDLARAIALSLQMNSPGTHKIYNLANERGFSNRQVIAAVEKVTGKKLQILTRARRIGDPAELVASSKKAHTELHWKPERPKIEEMIADAWRFYQQINQIIE